MRPMLYQDMAFAVGFIVVVNPAALRACATRLTGGSGAWRVWIRVVSATDLLRDGVQV